MKLKELNRLIENTVTEMLREYGELNPISKTIKVTYNPSMTRHAIERQLRHLEDQGIIIADREIIDLIDRGIVKITNYLIQDKIDIEDYIHLTDGDLNIIGFLKSGGEDKVNFIIITVMKKRNFKAKAGTKIVRL